MKEVMEPPRKKFKDCAVKYTPIPTAQIINPDILNPPENSSPFPVLKSIPGSFCFLMKKYSVKSIEKRGTKTAPTADRKSSNLLKSKNRAKIVVRIPVAHMV